MHFEIGCTDVNRTEKIFTALFDWKIQAAGIAATTDAASAQGIQGQVTAFGH